MKIVPAPRFEKIYGNPGFGGMMYTAGSNAVTSYYRPLRMMGAQVRRVLLDNAAGSGRAGRGTDHRTEHGGACEIRRRLSYGDIAAFAEVPAKAPEIKPEQLRSPPTSA